MRVVAALSGGLDSTVLAYLAEEEHTLEALISVNYGQRHKKELEYAAATAGRLHVPHYLIDLRSLNQLLPGSSLTDESVAVPHGSYSAESMKATIVPNRNAIIFSLLYAHANAIGADAIAGAMHAGDHAIYPDCRQEFFSALETALNIGSAWSNPIKIWTPFVEMTKAGIVARGDELGVPFDLTWSCYEGGAKHCGRCGTCVERLEAFHDASVIDLVPYVDSGYWRTVVGQGVPDSNAKLTQTRFALGGRID